MFIYCCQGIMLVPSIACNLRSYTIWDTASIFTSLRIPHIRALGWQFVHSELYRCNQQHLKFFTSAHDISKCHKVEMQKHWSLGLHSIMCSKGKIFIGRSKCSLPASDMTSCLYIGKSPLLKYIYLFFIQYK